MWASHLSNPIRNGQGHICSALRLNHMLWSMLSFKTKSIVLVTRDNSQFIRGLCVLTTEFIRFFNQNSSFYLWYSFLASFSTWVFHRWAFYLLLEEEKDVSLTHSIALYPLFFLNQKHGKRRAGYNFTLETFVTEQLLLNPKKSRSNFPLQETISHCPTWKAYFIS